MGIVAMKTTAGAFRDKSGPQLNSNAALKLVLQNENIASIVSGMSSIEELQKNLAMIQNLKMSEQAWHTLANAGLSGRSCDKCDTCSVNCIAAFNVKNKIADIVRLRDVPRDFVRA
jgi:predicted aldo/keto reductase-like oxidoreductase